MIVTLADIAGDGAAHAVTPQRVWARWIQFAAGQSNAATARIGDSSIGANAGIPLQPGFGMFFPLLAVDNSEGATKHLYDLSAIYYRLRQGDSLSITYVSI